LDLPGRASRGLGVGGGEEKGAWVSRAAAMAKPRGFAIVGSERTRQQRAGRRKGGGGAWVVAAATRKVAGPAPMPGRRRRRRGGGGNDEGCRPCARTSEERRTKLGGCGDGNA